ncbi:hypothetical protein ACLOJK_008782 [Asimina triloba]
MKMMEIRRQGERSGSWRWEGGRFVVDKQRDGKMVKKRREIGAVDRKKGFKEKEKEVDVDFLSSGREIGRKGRGEGKLVPVSKEEERILGEGGRGRWKESEEEKGDQRWSAERKKGFKGARGQ